VSRLITIAVVPDWTGEMVDSESVVKLRLGHKKELVLAVMADHLIKHGAIRTLVGNIQT